MCEVDGRERTSVHGGRRNNNNNNNNNSKNNKLPGPYFRNPNSVHQASVHEAVTFECDVANLGKKHGFFVHVR